MEEVCTAKGGKSCAALMAVQRCYKWDADRFRAKALGQRKKCVPVGRCALPLNPHPSTNNTLMKIFRIAKLSYLRPALRFFSLRLTKKFANWIQNCIRFLKTWRRLNWQNCWRKTFLSLTKGLCSKLWKSLLSFAAVTYQPLNFFSIYCTCYLPWPYKMLHHQSHIRYRELLDPSSSSNARHIAERKTVLPRLNYCLCNRYVVLTIAL